MAASLRKIEDASYALTVRGAEYGDSPDRVLVSPCRDAALRYRFSR